MSEPSVRAKRLHNQEGLPGGGRCGAEPARGQMPPGEDGLVVRKENRFACFPGANTRMSWGGGGRVTEEEGLHPPEGRVTFF